MKYRFKHIVEYAALRVLAFVFRILPYRLALCLAWAPAWISHFVFKFRLKEARRRIALVFEKNTNDKWVRDVAWLSWRNTIFSAVDMIRMPQITADWMAAHSYSSEVKEKLYKHSTTGVGAILAPPHMGAWDMSALSCVFLGIPIFSVAAKQKNPLTDSFIYTLRSSHKMESILRGAGTLKQVLRNLKKGHMLAILPDVRSRTESIAVPFLGGTANVAAGMGSFARHANVPVFPCIARRKGWAFHVFKVHPPVYPDYKLDKDEDVARITRHVLAIMDKEIRETPDQYFWYNKRWILDPVAKNNG